jgi:hypothetical protein
MVVQLVALCMNHVHCSNNCASGNATNWSVLSIGTGKLVLELSIPLDIWVPLLEVHHAGYNLTMGNMSSNKGDYIGLLHFSTIPHPYFVLYNFPRMVSCSLKYDH